MDTEVQVFNVETMGPVVSLHSVKWMLQDVADQGIGGVKLEGTIRMIGEVTRAAQREPIMRLAPSVPGGRVEPFIASIARFR